MGTHPIFESDFDCLTDQAIMDDLIMNDKSVGPSDATTNITEENTQTSECGNLQSEVLQSSEETFDLNTTSDLSVMTNQPLPERKKIRPPAWAIKAANQTKSTVPMHSKWFAPENTVKVDSTEADLERKNIIKSMSRKKNTNSVLSRWQVPEPEVTADDRLQGKELDSLRRYKERRKKRIQENNNTPSESDSSIHDKDKNSNTDIVSESLDVKSIMSQWKGSQISTREPVHQRPNRIESRINEEIRLAAEKEAEYRREKGVQHEYNIKPESYDK